MVYPAELQPFFVIASLFRKPHMIKPVLDEGVQEQEQGQRGGSRETFGKAVAHAECFDVRLSCETCCNVWSTRSRSVCQLVFVVRVTRRKQKLHGTGRSRNHVICLMPRWHGIDGFSHGLCCVLPVLIVQFFWVSKSCSCSSLATPWPCLSAL